MAKRPLGQLSSFSLIISILCSCNNPQDSAEEPLHASSPFPVGVAIGYSMLTNDTVMDMVSHEFNSMTAENELKMYGILRDGTYNFNRADEYIQYAEQNNMRMFGHTLLWHYGTPKAVKELEGDSAALQAFSQHYIDTLVTRYKGKIDAWDVANEVVLDKTGAFRENLWYNTLGPEYIEMAFRWAHQADPQARLFLNDYSLEQDSAKLEGFLAVIKDLKAKNVPVHGIGIQMHIRMDTPIETIKRHLSKCVETGLLIHFSELDIIFNSHNHQSGGGKLKYPELTREMNEQQAEKYRQIAQLYKEIVPPDQQYGITLWGFSDRDTWIRSFFDIMDWPLLFDDNYEKKPAYFGFKEGLSGK